MNKKTKHYKKKSRTTKEIRVGARGRGARFVRIYLPRVFFRRFFGAYQVEGGQKSIIGKKGSHV
jgi:hypothetical protein